MVHEKKKIFRVLLRSFLAFHWFLLQFQLPNYKNFRGTIQELGQNQYVVSGEIFVVDRNTVEITELPVRTWTQVSYSKKKSSILNSFILHAGEHFSPLLIILYAWKEMWFHSFHSFLCLCRRGFYLCHLLSILQRITASSPELIHNPPLFLLSRLS